MRFYQMQPSPGMAFNYYPDLVSVKRATRLLIGMQRIEARVKQIDIPTHKEALVQLLNGVNGPWTASRQWRITARHRYIEIPADEE